MTQDSNKMEGLGRSLKRISMAVLCCTPLINVLQFNQCDNVPNVSTNIQVEVKLDGFKRHEGYRPLFFKNTTVEKLTNKHSSVSVTTNGKPSSGFASNKALSHSIDKILLQRKLDVFLLLAEYVGLYKEKTAILFRHVFGLLLSPCLSRETLRPMMILEKKPDNDFGKINVPQIFIPVISIILLAWVTTLAYLFCKKRDESKLIVVPNSYYNEELKEERNEQYDSGIDCSASDFYKQNNNTQILVNNSASSAECLNRIRVRLIQTPT
ncbi:hypothetical protein HELRODRAFT_161264 [Helobdella robusta]|uniref:Uncharacterized protein n=1 Tax=Helobdella robusta TaxID=6412 RepID=T1ER97_HELRO|nr:hypothetical protein HELRODRAFT_161264 [Helobdella robusta]ESO02038.1 hypothetical protein HELRODRAFT_161264 [Helobdella robusta]